MPAGDHCPKCNSTNTTYSMQQNVQRLPDLTSPSGFTDVVLGRKEILNCKDCGHEKVERQGRI